MGVLSGSEIGFPLEVIEVPQKIRSTGRPCDAQPSARFRSGAEIPRVRPRPRNRRRETSLEMICVSTAAVSHQGTNNRCERCRTGFKS